MTNSTNQTEAEIHKVFDVTLVLKGIHAAIETIGGIFLYTISARSILRAVTFLVHDEIQEEPHDVFANYFLHLAQTFGGSAQSFAALYLLIHGLINALIVVALWKEKLWAYPVTFAALGAFIVYQLYLLTFGYSLWLVLFTVLDVIIIFLVWHEYGVLKKRRAIARKP
jgi:uncharacterized membrane protein